MDAIYKSCLVLNSAFEPISTCSAKRALTLACKNKVKIEEASEQIVHTTKMWDEVTGEFVEIHMYLPCVIRLLEYRYIPIRTQLVTRENIFNRDNYTCMYCGNVFTSRNLTLDHIIPKSRGGKGTWENLVTCCKPCNRKKGDYMLHELKNMSLICKPKSLNIHTSRFILRNKGVNDPLWKKYLFFDSNSGQEGVHYEKSGTPS